MIADLVIILSRMTKEALNRIGSHAAKLRENSDQLRHTDLSTLPIYMDEYSPCLHEEHRQAATSSRNSPYVWPPGYRHPFPILAALLPNLILQYRNPFRCTIRLFPSARHFSLCNLASCEDRTLSPLA